MSQTTRIFLAGFLGGVVMMIWMTVAHMVSPLGQIGFQNLPNDDAARGALSASMGSKPGMYGFPAMDMQLAAKDMGASMKAYEEKSRTGPSGFVIYHPAGQALNMGASAVQEFGKLWIVATIAAFLLAEASALLGYGARVGFVAAIGAIASMSTNVSYRAWYGFPGDYTAAAIFMEFVGYVAGGLVIAWLVKPRPVPPVT